MSLADPKTKTVLIVDDDESVLNLLEVLVRRDGFQIDLASNGAEAIEKLKRGPDALILDLMLPGTTSGFEVLKHLHAAQGPVPPVIVVTAISQSKEAQQVMKDPLVVQFLAKPVNQEKLLSSLHRAMGTQPPPPPKPVKLPPQPPQA